MLLLYGLLEFRGCKVNLIQNTWSGKLINNSKSLLCFDTKSKWFVFTIQQTACANLVLHVPSSKCRSYYIDKTAQISFVENMQMYTFTMRKAILQIWNLIAAAVFAYFLVLLKVKYKHTHKNISSVATKEALAQCQMMEVDCVRMYCKYIWPSEITIIE